MQLHSLLPPNLRLKLLWGIGVIGGAVGLLLTGCSRSGSAVERAYAERALHVGNGIEPSTLDPHINTGSSESAILSEIYEPLVERGDDGLTLVPAAAASWAVSPDGLTYTFHLRQDRRWSNGDPVTADDFLQSFRRFVDPRLAAEFSARATSVVGVPAYLRGELKDPTQLGFSAPDPYTFVITLSAPNVVFIQNLIAYPWVPVHMPTLDATGGRLRDNQNWVKPGVMVTNGALQLTEWRPNSRIVLTPNPHHPDHTKVWLRTVNYYPIEDLDTEERAYRAGQLHATTSLPSAKVATYVAEKNPALQITPRLGVSFFVFNTRRPPFDDPRVRQAFSAAIDRAALVKAAYQGGYTAAYTLSQPGMGGYQPAAPITDGPGEARDLLAAAGYPDGKGFPPITYLYNTLDRNRVVAEIVQQMWARELGVKVELVNQEWKVFLDTRHRGDYSIARAGWNPFANEPTDYFELFITGGSNNETGWSNPTFDALYQQALQTFDVPARHALYQTMDGIIRDEAPCAPLVFSSTVRLVHPSVQHWPNNIMDSRSLRNVTLVGETP
ncbi:MAG: peptide ABC transporter substrate-binding protein [Cephaloticoccus sp.]|nr:peptide ABC transporter substrate-binding protein [Cephaloticoccus sp.]MCF7761023.1 peptide ABC transporter substrate-binding protein [Cephaloticoccus sp.]